MGNGFYIPVLQFFYKYFATLSLLTKMDCSGDLLLIFRGADADCRNI
jgi:hypothetical protein